MGERFCRKDDPGGACAPGQTVTKLGRMTTPGVVALSVVGAIALALLVMLVVQQVTFAVGVDQWPTGEVIVVLRDHSAPEPGDDFRGLAMHADALASPLTSPSTYQDPSGTDAKPFTVSEFSKADRVDLYTRKLVMPTCVDPSNPLVRYAFAQPDSEGTLQLVTFSGGLPSAGIPDSNQVNAWPNGGALTVESTTYDVYVSSHKLDCRDYGGVTMAVYP